jgi:hypothetical protein
MAGLNATAKNAMLDAASTVWPPDTLSLHSSDPGSGTSVGAGTELTGGSPAYARKSVTWAAASASAKAASALPTFDVPAASTVSHLGYWRGSTYLGSRALSASETYTGQGTYTPTSLSESLT